MRDRINRLAKGINELETPEIVMSPESVLMSLKEDTLDSFIIELTSQNGFSIKGICCSDDIKVMPEQAAFAGRRVHFAVNVDTVGLRAGDSLSGTLHFITNAGELDFCYQFNIAEKSGPDDAFESRNITEEASLISYIGHDRAAENISVTPKFPESDEAFEETVAELIGIKDTSRTAYLAYKEAIERHLSITRLYESYVLAYPDGCADRMPREVLLYFSYDSELIPEVAEKLYYDIIRYERDDAELFDSFSARMSAFAMSNAVSGRINSRLSLIYDEMIYRGMVDRKAAEVLPDLFKCCKFVIKGGEADIVRIGYRELNTVFTAKITDNISYIPVFFEDAAISFEKSIEGKDENGGCISEKKDVTSEITYSASRCFNKPELLEKCFELYQEHPMLMLSACRKLLSDGISERQDVQALEYALSVLNLSHEYRKRIVSALCSVSTDLGWLNALKPDDYDKASCRDIFSAYIRAERYNDAYKLIRQFGIGDTDEQELRLMTEALIENPPEDLSNDRCFAAVCKHLFDSGIETDRILSFLSMHYTGSIDEMLKVFNAVQKANIPADDLSERLITLELFSGIDGEIDRVFKAYTESSKNEDLVIRAYLAKRSADYFLYDKELENDILFDVLKAYFIKLGNASQLPVICSIALTKYYADRTDMTDEELKLCQRLTDGLIEDGLIFRYTKKLRKKIRIPEEIGWKYYIEYHSRSGEQPRLLVKISPDDNDYHTEEMKRVYKNVFIMSTVLFTGDKLHYLVYDRTSGRLADEEGIISVTKVHGHGNVRVRTINQIMKAIDTKNVEQLKEEMLSYVENSETVRTLFGPES